MRRTLLLALLLTPLPSRAEDRGLIGHWRFSGDANDASGRGNHGRAFAVDLTAPGPGGRTRGAARFDGKSSYVEVPASPALGLGKGDFTLAVWVHTEESLDDVLGDLVSKYDPAARRGLNWCIKSGAGMTNSQANDRNVQFGIDAGTEPVWSDRGRPGNAVYVMAMAVHDGKLFVGTCEAGPGEAGHVYRYDGGSRWVDCGSPDRCNAVTSLAAFGGKLYAGTGRYRLAGSALPESTNANLGGKIVRYDGDGNWADCGRLPDVEAVGGMVGLPRRTLRLVAVQAGRLLPLPGGRLVAALPPARRRPPGRRPRRLQRGSLRGVVRLLLRLPVRRRGLGGLPGDLESTGQTYSFEVHAGELFVGTWPNGQVFRLDRGERWVPAGRLGEEKEVMGMAVHNGKLYAGTLPLAEVYRFDDGTRWTRTGRLDLTPDVRYRRAWSMAVFDGRLFCGTLPSGRVHALEVGQSVTYDRALAPGWRHLAAVREGGRLSLFVDGTRVASSSSSNAPPLDLTNRQPLRIGFGTLRPFPRQPQRPPPLRPGTLGRRDRRPDGARRQGLTAVGERVRDVRAGRELPRRAVEVERDSRAKGTG